MHVPSAYRLLLHAVFASYWVALCAALLAWLSYAEAGGDGLPVRLMVLVSGATLIIYNLNMLTGLPALRKASALPKRHRWCVDNESKLLSALGCGVLMALIGAGGLLLRSYLVLLPFAALALLYTVPMVGGRKLRESGLAKPLMVGAAWAAVTALLPITVVGVGCSLTTVLMVAERFVMVTALAMAFDIRDAPQDAALGIRTMAVRLGAVRSARLCALLLGLFVLLALCRLMPVGQWPSVAAYLVSGSIAAALCLAASRQRDELFFSFHLEGTMALLAVLGLVAMAV